MKSKTHINITSACTFKDVAVIGTNPEMADYTNPDGHVFGEVVFIEAVTHEGQRYRLIDADRLLKGDMIEAQRLVDRVLKRGYIRTDYWYASYPVYGSPAWEMEDKENQLTGVCL